MARITWSNQTPEIGVDWGEGKDYPATYIKSCDVTKDTYTQKNDFEEEVRSIRWFWPYKLREHIKSAVSISQIYKVTIGGKSYPGTIISGSSYGNLAQSFVIPIEYRLPTEKEIDNFYPGLKSWNFSNIKMIFYEETFCDGKRKLNYCAPYRFFSEYEPEKE
jgi:hypothetical protein